MHSALIIGNQRAVQAFTDQRTAAGCSSARRDCGRASTSPTTDRLRLVWINKLPFAPFAAPVIEARREAVKVRAELAGAEDPDAVATETYYLPLAALQLRQAVGRLIRSERHRGVIVISDRKLAGVPPRCAAPTGRPSSARSTPGCCGPTRTPASPTGGNVTTMAEGGDGSGRSSPAMGCSTPRRAAELSTDEALEAHTLLPQTRRIRSLALTTGQVDELRAVGPARRRGRRTGRAGRGAAASVRRPGRA